MGEEHIGQTLECGCKAEIVDDEIQVTPCSAAHEPVLAKVARKLAASMNVEYVERHA